MNKGGGGGRKGQKGLRGCVGWFLRNGVGRAVRRRIRFFKLHIVQPL